MFIMDLRTADYPEVTAEHLGLIPLFFRDAAEELDGADAPIESLAEGMDARYGYGGFLSYPMSGKVTEGTGDYVCPTDPDLKPMAALYCRGYVCYIYPYSIVAIRRDNGDTLVTRMD